MGLRRREYLGEARNSVSIEYPTFRHISGDDPTSRYKELKRKKRVRESEVRDGVAKVLTWTKGKTSLLDRWSLVRLFWSDGKQEDIYFNFYDATGSLGASKAKPIYLTAFFKRDPQDRMMVEYVPSLRAAMTRAREWLKKYVMDRPIVRLDRIPTNMKPIDKSKQKAWD